MKAGTLKVVTVSMKIAWSLASPCILLMEAFSACIKSLLVCILYCIYYLGIIFYRPRRGGYHIAVQEIEDAVRPSVRPRRINFQDTNAVGLYLAFYESP